jgi:hypothetical protein
MARHNQTYIVICTRVLALLLPKGAKYGNGNFIAVLIGRKGALELDSRMRVLTLSFLAQIRSLWLNLW